MCTAVAYKSNDFCFGRTLDSEIAYKCGVTYTPRNFSFEFRFADSLPKHYSIIGMAYVCKGYPLYFDGMNEAGLTMAGLNFVGNAVYRKPAKNKVNIASFEFIPYILSLCDSVASAKALLENINITDTAFSQDLPPAQLHWMIADKNEAVTVESVKDGLRVYENSAGVLTNNPPFPIQMMNYRKFSHLTPRHKVAEETSQEYSSFTRGTGAIGLPGDYTSQSRFVRAAFVKNNSLCDDTQESCVNQFFHILDSVSVPRGCCMTEDSLADFTRYACCMNVPQKAYYCKTYESNVIRCAQMKNENADSECIVSYPLVNENKIVELN